MLGVVTMFSKDAYKSADESDEEGNCKANVFESVLGHERAHIRHNLPAASTGQAFVAMTGGRMSALRSNRPVSLQIPRPWMVSQIQVIAHHLSAPWKSTSPGSDEERV